MPARMIFVIVLNAAVVAAELGFGLAANSMALIADAAHNLGDVLTLGIALAALVAGKRKATRKMSYGYVRAEMLGGFVNSLILILGMLYVSYESVLRLLKPQPVSGLPMMIVAGGAFAVNAFSAFLLRKRNGSAYAHAGHPHCPEDGEDQNLRAAYLHLVGDAGLSLGVVLGGVLIHYLKIPMIDPVISLLFALFIVTECLKVFKVSLFSLLDATPRHLEQIEKAILSRHDVISIHDIHLTRPSSREVHFSAHIVLRDGITLDGIEWLFEQLREDLKTLGVTHPVFQPETSKYHKDDPLCHPHCN